LLLSDAESGHLRNVLAMTGWRVRGKDGAAELLGVKPTTLDSMLVRHGIAHGCEQSWVLKKSLSEKTAADLGIENVQPSRESRL
jgi:hypothetical protein